MTVGKRDIIATIKKCAFPLFHMTLKVINDTMMARMPDFTNKRVLPSSAFDA